MVVNTVMCRCGHYSYEHADTANPAWKAARRFIFDVIVGDGKCSQCPCMKVEPKSFASRRPCNKI